MVKALRSHKLYVPLITVLGSVGLFLVYYFFYVAWQRSYANERAFRLLSVVSDQMVKRFDNLRNTLAASSSYSTEDAEAYLKRVPVLKDEVSNVQSKPTGSGSPNRDGVLKLWRLNTPQTFAVRAEYRVGSSNSKQPAACASDQSTPFVCADVVLDAELRDRFHSLTDEYFDDILIATRSGEVFFQKNLSGLRITNLNALLPSSAPESSLPKAATTESNATASKPPKTAAAFLQTSQFSNVVDVKLGGTDYKLYVQPVPVALADPDSQTDLKLIVCGLWRSDRLQSEVVSIPYSVLIWCSLLLLSCFALTWPLLKVAYMSPSERLRRKHVFYLLFSALFVTMLLTTIVLNLSYTVRGEEESKEQLESLANRIDQNVRAELVRTLKLLDVLGKDDGFLQPAFRAVTDTDWTKGNFLQTGFFAKRDPSEFYPYFDNIFWVDGAGLQQYKLTVQRRATPRTPITNETYFQDVRDNRHLTSVQGVDFPFRSHSLYSPNTGEFFVVLSKRYKTPAEWTNLPAQLRDLRAQMLVAKFLSLVDPIVPAGFGFAVVGPDGIVQFHSIAAHDQIEDFFTECREDPALKALVLNGGSDHLNVNYMGRRQQMFVEPLPYLGVPAPALVVFRDTNYFSTINVACILVFSILAGLFGLPFLVAMFMCVYRPADYPLASLWPSLDDFPKYVNVVAANICLTIAFAIRFPSMKMDETLLDVLTVIIIGAGFGSLKPAWARGKWAMLLKAPVLVALILVARWSPALVAAALYVALSVPGVSEALTNLAARTLTLRRLYVAVVLSLLTVLVVLPCFGLFKISYDTVNRLALESAQLARKDQLVRRADDVNDYFLNLKSKGGVDENRFKEYVEKRVAERLDRYDEPVYYPKDQVKDLKRGDLDISRLEGTIAWASGFFPSNRLGAELREVATLKRGGTDWQSAQDGDDELLWMNGLPKTVVPEGSLLGVYPLWQLPRQAGLLMVPFGLLLIVWLRLVVKKVFLTDLEDVPPLENWALDDRGRRNLLIIGHPKSGKTSRAAALPDADILDIARAVTTGNWTLPALRHDTIVVNHFEFDIDNPDSCLRKLDLLEHLLYVEKKRVVLLSAVDPMFYLAASSPEIVTPSGAGTEPPEQILDRWAVVLGQFHKLRMEDVTKNYFDRVIAEQDQPCQAELVNMVRDECDHTAQLRRIGLDMLIAHCGEPPMSKRMFVEELLDRADSYYRVLYSNCTKGERLVLFQLAHDGWVNPKNERAIQQLQRRGVIRKGSGFRFMNRSFCQFVRNEQRPDEVARWEQEEEHSTWSAVKLGLSTALLMLGAWLLYAQQDVFQLGIGYIAALGTATGAVLNLTRNLTGRGGSAKSGQSKAG